MTAWGLEMVQRKKLDFVCINFMIAGHTKFVPYVLFSKASKSYSVSDVFTTSELCHIVESFASVVVDDDISSASGEMFCQNTQSYLVYAAYMTSFVLEKPSTGNAYVRVRDVCYERFVIAVSRLLGAVDQQEMLFLERSTHTYQAEYKAYGLGPYVQELHST